MFVCVQKAITLKFGADSDRYQSCVYVFVSLKEGAANSLVSDPQLQKDFSHIQTEKSLLEV